MKKAPSVQGRKELLSRYHLGLTATSCEAAITLSDPRVTGERIKCERRILAVTGDPVETYPDTVSVSRLPGDIRRLGDGRSRRGDSLSVITMLQGLAADGPFLFPRPLVQPVARQLAPPTPPDPRRSIYPVSSYYTTVPASVNGSRPMKCHKG